MLNRDIINTLKNWAMTKNRKPLVLRGARQVGKTTSIELFSKEFDQYVYINLERPGQIDFFKKNMPVRDLFSAILLSKNMQKTAGRCLLFIDEIQQCPEAVTYLRYFYEEMSELHVCAAGSLLEVMLNKGHISFPVGRVQFMYLYPLSFSEYLHAINQTEAIALFDTVPTPAYANEILFRHFHTYALIGGMPEIVAQYAQNKEITSLTKIYQDLFSSFIDDIPKYAPNHSQAQVMRFCLERVPSECGNRITFAGFGRSEYRSREAGEALRTLEKAMLLHLVYPTVNVSLPAIADIKKSPRLHFMDTGMLLALAGLQQHFISIDNLHSQYKGFIAEHITGQELLSTNVSDKLLFWVRESPQSNAEVDYIIDWNGRIIPVEVKSGSTGSMRSLHQFIDRCDHEMAVRLYHGSIDISECKTLNGKKFKLLSLPYYLASRIRQYCDWAFLK